MISFVNDSLHVLYHLVFNQFLMASRDLLVVFFQRELQTRNVEFIACVCKKVDAPACLTVCFLSV